MAYRKKTLRTMSPTARKVARLTGELDSIARRFKNLIPELQGLDLDSRALENAKQAYTFKESLPCETPRKFEGEHHYLVLQNPHYKTWRIEELWEGGTIRSPFNSAGDAIERERVIAEDYGFLDTLYLDNAEDLPKR